MAPLEVCFHTLIADSPDMVTQDMVEDNEGFADLCESRVAEVIHRCILELPRERGEEGVLGVLDGIVDRKFILPRQMPCPKKKVKSTKWAKFAESKGIVKSKHRNRLVYDPVDSTYKLRYGGRSIKKDEKARDFIFEHKSNAKTFPDPFEEKAQRHALDKAKQKLRQVKNKVYAAGYKLGGSGKR